MQLGIRGKLLTGFGVVLILLAVVSAIGYRNSVVFDAAFDALYGDQMVMTTQLGRAQQALYELRLGATRYATTDAQTRAAIRADEGRWVGQVDAAMKAFTSLEITQEERVTLTAWQEVYPACLTSRAATWISPTRGARCWSTANSDTVGRAAVREASSALDHLIELPDDLAAVAKPRSLGHHGLLQALQATLSWWRPSTTSRSRPTCWP